ncbi:MAG: group 1 truncated hemoglobin [Candidatus Competibacteraceae bacterium]|nr:group 1 truncated hemoglobin [Candidatus Competibacteraceae bacterium]
MIKRGILKHLLIGVLCINLFFIQGCDNNSSHDSLYGEMGGLDSISGVVDQWLLNMEADTVIYPRFEPVMTDSIMRLNMRNHMVDQFCMLAGGPCIYKGRTMRNAHAGMMITSDEFDLAMLALSDALLAKGISGSVRDRFMARIQAIQLEIVNQ